jgi:hypothetical protein
LPSEPLTFGDLFRRQVFVRSISVVQRILMTSRCCNLQPHIGRSAIHWHAPTSGIHHPKMILRVCLSLFGKWASFCKGGGIITIVIGGHAFIKITRHGRLQNNRHNQQQFNFLWKCEMGIVFGHRFPQQGGFGCD